MVKGGHCDNSAQWQERVLGLFKTDRVKHHLLRTFGVPILNAFEYIDVCLRYIAERRRYDPNSIGYTVIV